jgi:hypothetical protein
MGEINVYKILVEEPEKNMNQLEDQEEGGRIIIQEVLGKIFRLLSLHKSFI